MAVLSRDKYVVHPSRGVNGAEQGHANGLQSGKITSQFFKVPQGHREQAATGDGTTKKPVITNTNSTSNRNVSTFRLLIIISACLLESAFLAGTILGWASLVYILQEDGIYSDLCETGFSSASRDTISNTSALTNAINDTDLSPVKCPEQVKTLSIAFTIALVIMGISVLPLGLFLDVYGIRATRILITSSGFVSSLFIAFTTKAHPWLCIIGASMLGVCGPSTNMVHGNVALLAGNHANTLRGTLQGLLTSGITFQLVKIAYDAGIVRQYSMLVVAAVWLLAVVLCAGFPQEKVQKNTAKQGKESALSVVGDNRSLKDCIFSLTFLLFVMWLFTIHTCLQLHASRINQWVAYVLGEDRVSQMADLQAWLLLGCILLSPLSGLLTDFTQSRLKSNNLAVSVAPSMFVASVACLIMMAASLLNNEKGIMVNIYVCPIGKSFTYSSVGAFVSNTFPIKHYGLISGIAFGFIGLASSVNYGFLSWMADDPDNAFFYSHLIVLLTTVVSFGSPCFSIYHYVTVERHSKTLSETPMQMVPGTILSTTRHLLLAWAVPTIQFHQLLEKSTQPTTSLSVVSSQGYANEAYSERL